MKTGRRQGIPELKKKDFLSHKSHSCGFIVICAYSTFPPGYTEVMQRGPLRTFPDAIGYVKEERWACFIVSERKPTVCLVWGWVLGTYLISHVYLL